MFPTGSLAARSLTGSGPRLAGEPSCYYTARLTEPSNLHLEASRMPALSACAWALPQQPHAALQRIRSAGFEWADVRPDSWAGLRAT